MAERWSSRLGFVLGGASAVVGLVCRARVRDAGDANGSAALRSTPGR